MSCRAIKSISLLPSISETSNILIVLKQLVPFIGDGVDKIWGLN